jgi:hypothetical protein
VYSAVKFGVSCPEIEYRSYSDPELEGIELGCWFCPKCLDRHHLPPTRTTIPDSDGFLTHTNELYRPICPGCFDEWQNPGVQT